MAILIRRTLMRTWAPIFRSLRRMVPQVASGELGVAQADPAQRREQDVGEGREPQPELVGAHGRCRRAIGEQVELLLLDPVLDFAAGAVDVLVETAASISAAAARSRRSAGWRPWADARPWRRRGASGSSCPACARRSRRSGAPGRPWPGSRPRRRPDRRRWRRPGARCARARRRSRPGSPRTTPSAPRGQSRVRPQQDLHPRPARPDLGHDAPRPPRPHRPTHRCSSA